MTDLMYSLLQEVHTPIITPVATQQSIQEYTTLRQHQQACREGICIVGWPEQRPHPNRYDAMLTSTSEALVIRVDICYGQRPRIKRCRHLISMLGL